MIRAFAYVTAAWCKVSSDQVFEKDGKYYITELAEVGI
jgi:hypothetical protein